MWPRDSGSSALRLLLVVGFALLATSDRCDDTLLVPGARLGALLGGSLLSPSLEVNDSWLVTVSCRFLRTPLAVVVIPRPFGVDAPPCLVRCTPTALLSDTSEALRGRAAPRGDGTVGRL